MDKKKRVKNIRKLVKQRIELKKELDDLDDYKKKMEKVRKKYAGDSKDNN
ncbi:MAG TPA: hypothetical protein VMX18_02920 [Candidatus Bipolaricaulota bacterium]|nr:hypothetical protein [Candidatus Bipolaricaulota bacterium]